MELVLPMYNVHPYFSLKNLGKNCTLFIFLFIEKKSEALMCTCRAQGFA